jgi:selenobiotic family peptide radical SAM maturase
MVKAHEPARRTQVAFKKMRPKRELTSRKRQTRRERADETVSKQPYGLYGSFNSGRAFYIMSSLSKLQKSNVMDYIPRCLSLMGDARMYFENELPQTFSEEMLIDVIGRSSEKGAPRFFPELARLELAFYHTENTRSAIENKSTISVNPTLHIVRVTWQNLPEILHGVEVRDAPPLDDPEMLLIYRNHHSGKTEVRRADSEDLLALKLVVEDIDTDEFINTSSLSLRNIDDIIDNADSAGLLIKPKSRIIRDPVDFPRGENIDEEYFESDFFTLQWHITQACELNCRHCYDRTSRSTPDLAACMRIIEELRQFCDSRNVRGQISFTGGNPLLHPNFLDLYRAANEKGLYMAILGNPTPRGDIEKIVDISMPEFFQISLEGLEEHNDYIRGKGHFRRAMEFLDILRDLGVYALVMLTLTRDNIDQVLPLAQILRDRADRFTFNRLALFGEGAGLALPEKGTYMKFLEGYLKAAGDNPLLGLKDNLINILKTKAGQDPFCGCAGYGCGAAFNFVSLLSDGEVHACRKLPSLIGNLHKDSLANIYDSEIANRYRMGSSACAECSIRPVCGGCLAVTSSCGFDIFTEKDPMCFMND